MTASAITKSAKSRFPKRTSQIESAIAKKTSAIFAIKMKNRKNPIEIAFFTTNVAKNKKMQAKTAIVYARGEETANFQSGKTNAHPKTMHKKRSATIFPAEESNAP